MSQLFRKLQKINIQIMKQVLALFIAFMALTSCSEAQVNEDDNGTTNEVVSAEKFNELLAGDIQLIDVRTAEEYNGGHIGDAVNIDFYGADFEEQLKKMDPEKMTLVYCAAGGRSGKAAKIMEDLGFFIVYDLKGGYGNWPYK